MAGHAFRTTNTCPICEEAEKARYLKAQEALKADEFSFGSFVAFLIGLGSLVGLGALGGAYWGEPVGGACLGGVLFLFSLASGPPKRA